MGNLVPLIVLVNTEASPQGRDMEFPTWVSIIKALTTFTANIQRNLIFTIWYHRNKWTLESDSFELESGYGQLLTL